MMALSNLLLHNLTRHDLKDLAATFVSRRSTYPTLEPWPHWVHYRAPRKPVHCPPNTFGFIGEYGPTDCDWMVPNWESIWLSTHGCDGKNSGAAPRLVRLATTS